MAQIDGHLKDFLFAVFPHMLELIWKSLLCGAPFNPQTPSRGVPRSHHFVPTLGSTVMPAVFWFLSDDCLRLHVMAASNVTLDSMLPAGCAMLVVRLKHSFKRYRPLETESAETFWAPIVAQCLRAFADMFNIQFLVSFAALIYVLDWKNFCCTGRELRWCENNDVLTICTTFMIYLSTAIGLTPSGSGLFCLYCVRESGWKLWNKNLDTIPPLGVQPFSTRNNQFSYDNQFSYEQPVQLFT